LAFIFYGKLIVKVFVFTTMWACAISISMSLKVIEVFPYMEKPKRNVSSQPLHLVLLIHVHLTFGRFVWTKWYIYNGGEFHQHIVKAHPWDNWEFWSTDIASVAMTNQVKVLLNSFGLFDKVIAYVKDERFNVSTLTFTLTFMVSCPTF